jgi:uncharacterized caspase-like protein
MSDLLFQNLSTVQSNQQPLPATVASAATIVPTGFITFVTGTTDIATVTPPVTGAHMLVLIATNGSPGDLLTTGNILVGTTTVTQNAPILLFFDPIQAKYYVK